VAAETAKIDEAVAAGRLTEEKAAALKERLPERAAAVVNGEARLGRRGPHRPG
jgi:hypothetical protein